MTSRLPAQARSDRARLRSRWTSATRDQTLAALASGVVPEPFGRLDGRIDLRGLQAPPVPTMPVMTTPSAEVHQLQSWRTVTGLVMEGVDLSHAVLDDFAFLGGRMTDVVIRHASLRRSRYLECDWERVTVEGSDLRDSSWSRDRLASVTFARSDLRGGTANDTLQEHVRYEDDELSRFEFHGSALVDVTYTGRLDDMMFIGIGLGGHPTTHVPRLTRVDFARATFTYVGFARLELDDVTLPTQDDLHVVTHYHCVLQHWLAALSGRTDREDAGRIAWLEEELRSTLPGQSIGVIYDEELRGLAGSRDLALETIRELERQCGG
jgi:uncharacterized protein YjbI with pentapeptide repeats